MGAPEDRATSAKNVIDYAHHEVHAGSHFHYNYSILSLGAATTPDDMMTISWKTPNTEKQLHMVVAAICSSGGRFRFIEGKTGGGATPTGLGVTYNNNRVKENTSIILDVAGGNEGQVSLDATLFTGGISLVDEYIGADGQGNSFVAGSARSEQEWMLKPDTFYQLSIYETDTVPGTLQMAWYEHTSIR